jgi:hypothetical protein
VHAPGRVDQREVGAVKLLAGTGERPQPRGGQQLSLFALVRADLSLAERPEAGQQPVQRDRDARDLLGVLKAAGSYAIDTEASEAAPAKALRRRYVQRGPAMQERPRSEQPPGAQALKALVGPAAPHPEAAHHMLGAGRAERPHPPHDLRITLGLHHNHLQSCRGKNRPFPYSGNVERAGQSPPISVA